jgi:hypothetical protein
MESKRNAMSINIGPAMRYIAALNEISIAVSYSQSLSQIVSTKIHKIEDKFYFNFSYFSLGHWDR